MVQKEEGNQKIERPRKGLNIGHPTDPIQQRALPYHFTLHTNSNMTRNSRVGEILYVVTFERFHNRETHTPKRRKVIRFQGRKWRKVACMRAYECGKEGVKKKKKAEGDTKRRRKAARKELFSFFFSNRDRNSNEGRGLHTIGHCRTELFLHTYTPLSVGIQYIRKNK